MPSTKIKVLNFLTHFGLGGTERQFVYLTKGLDRTRFDVQVGCLARAGTFLEDVEAMGVPILEYKTNSMFSYQTMRGQLRLAADIRKQRIQIVHAYGFYPNIFTVPSALMARRCVTITSIRDLGAFPDRARTRGLAQATACRFADCILANSYAARGWLEKQGLRSADIRVIPNGIAVPDPRASTDGFPIRAELKIPEDAPVIAFVGRLMRLKGIEFFLEALPAVAQRFPSARFLIVGDACINPPYRVELENRAAALNLPGRAMFIGQRTDVPKILKEVTISVLPSLSESFSNSLLESMANGLPVIATNVGGNPELVTDDETGLLVPPRDPSALSRAMIRVLESRELAHRLGQAAREKVIKHYSLDAVLHQIEDLYTLLLERRGLMPQLEPAGLRETA